MSHVPRLLSLSASAEIAVLIVNQTRDGKLGLFCFASQFTAAVNGTGKLGFTRSYWHGMRTFQCKRSSDTTLAVQCTVQLDRCQYLDSSQSSLLLLLVIVFRPPEGSTRVSYPRPTLEYRPLTFVLLILSTNAKERKLNESTTSFLTIVETLIV